MIVTAKTRNRITLANDSICVSFDNNALLASLFGEQDKHLLRIEKELEVVASSRGNIISLSGRKKSVGQAKQILETLYHKLEQGMEVTLNDVDAAIRMVAGPQDPPKNKDALFDEEIIIKTIKKQITPYSNTQKEYLRQLLSKEMVFSTGPAGTGKTYLAVAIAVSMFLNHKIERIVLCRPAVEAGEKIGFLPGDMKDKVDPYMQPLYDALFEMIPAEKVEKHIENRIIEIAPLAFMRGRTLRNAFIILDEAQNATAGQMKMFLTRLGENSRMVINGDLSQIDLPSNTQSGLDHALNKLRNIEEIGHVKFTDKDIVRHALVTKIVQAYDAK